MTGKLLELHFFIWISTHGILILVVTCVLIHTLLKLETLAAFVMGQDVKTVGKGWILN